MCGRFALHAPIEEIRSHFKLRAGFSMQARYNIAPTQTIPIITQHHAGVVFSRWSFIPYWVKASEDNLPNGYINARSETVQEKPAFKQAFLTQRCIIPASGYFEWKLLQGKKQPFYITAKDHSLIGLAGLWSLWLKSPWEKVMTCTIITTPANTYLSRIHERAPLVLAPQTYANWLNTSEKITVLKTIMLNENAFQWHARPVSVQVNSPKIDEPSCIVSL